MKNIIKNHFKFILIGMLVIAISIIIGVYKYENSTYQIPVLMYHHFLTGEEEDAYQTDKGYCITTENFDKQMEYLHDNGYTCLTMEQLYEYKKGKIDVPQKSFAITIDDGLLSSVDRAKPILAKYGFSAAVFVIGSAANPTTASTFDPTVHYQYIGIDVINERDNVLEYGSHTYDMHKIINGQKSLETMSYAQMLEDAKKEKSLINSDYIAYPYTTYSRDLIKSLKAAGYKMAFRGNEKKTVKYENLYLTSRIGATDDMQKFYDIFETNKYDFKPTLKQFLSDFLKTF